MWNGYGINDFVVSVVGLEGKSRLGVFIWFVFVSGYGSFEFWMAHVFFYVLWLFYLGLLYPYVIWIGHGMYGVVLRGLNVVTFEGKSRIVLGGYGGGHGRVLISCTGLHVGRRLCSCLAKAFWIWDSLWCLLLLAWLLWAVNSLFSLGWKWYVFSLEGKARIWRCGRCFDPRRT